MSKDFKVGVIPPEKWPLDEACVVIHFENSPDASAFCAEPEKAVQIAMNCMDKYGMAVKAVLFRDIETAQKFSNEWVKSGGASRKIAKH